MDRVSVPLRRGDVWEAEFDPVRGREQADRRPALIGSADRFHQGNSQLAFVLPLTRTVRESPWQVTLQPPEGGVTAASFVMCDQLRVFSVERLLRRRDAISSSSLAEVEDRLRILLDLWSS